MYPARTDPQRSNPGFLFGVGKGRLKDALQQGSMVLTGAAVLVVALNLPNKGTTVGATDSHSWKHWSLMAQSSTQGKRPLTTPGRKGHEVEQTSPGGKGSKEGAPTSGSGAYDQLKQYLEDIINKKQGPHPQQDVEPLTKGYDPRQKQTPFPLMDRPRRRW
jgi:hypothetical protein